MSKADFVYLMVRLAQVDRETYRMLRDMGWIHAEAHRILDGKSEFPN